MDNEQILYILLDVLDHMYSYIIYTYIIYVSMSFLNINVYRMFSF